MSDEQNLTIVGGKVIEQHEALDSNVDADTREDAMSAVREAIKNAADESKSSAKKASEQDPYKPAGAKNSKDEEAEVSGKSPVGKKPAKTGDEAPERGPDGKFLPREGKKPESDSTDDDSDESEAHSLKNLLKHREKNAAPKKDVQTQLAKERQEIQEQTRKLQETWQQMQQEQARIEKEKARFARLRADPAAAIREVGWEPEQFIVDLAREGTPEGAMARQQRELQQQLQEMRQWKEQQQQQYQQAQERAQWEQQVSYRQHIEKTFLDDATNEESRPHTAALYKGREHALLAYADKIAAEYREVSGGKEASLKEVADFIEEELAERLNGWYVKKSGTKVAATPGSGEARPGKGSKGKSLTPEASSERRSLGRKGLKDLDEEERIAAARAAVSTALETDD